MRAVRAIHTGKIMKPGMLDIEEMPFLFKLVRSTKVRECSNCQGIINKGEDYIKPEGVLRFIACLGCVEW